MKTGGTVVITDAADARALAGLARQTTGRVEVLVNVAGYFPVQPFLEMTTADWREIIDVNLTGAALMRQALLPLMTGRGWGRIINIGSASICAGAPAFSPPPDADFITGQTIIVDGGSEML